MRRIGIGLLVAVAFIATIPASAAVNSTGLSAVGYDNLAQAEVELADIYLALGLGSPDEIATSEVSLGDVFSVMITALNNQGDPASVAAATALGTLQAQTSQSLSLVLGDVVDLNVSSTDEVAGVKVNVLEMVTGSAEAANGDHLIETDLPITIPGVAKVELAMGLIEPPVRSIGPARQDALGGWVNTAHTAQTRIALILTLTSNVTVGLQSAPITLPLYIETAGTDSSVTAISCDEPTTSSSVTIHVQTYGYSSYVGSVSKSALTNKSAPVTPTPGSLVSIPGVLTVTGYASSSVGGTTQDLTFTGPFDTREQTVGAVSGSFDGFAGGVGLTVTGVGALLGATISSQVQAAIDPVLRAIDTSILDILTSTPLQVDFAGADIANPALNCTTRSLGT